MKLRTSFFTSILLAAAFCAATYAAEGPRIGAVHSVNKARGEIVVAAPGSGGKIQAGDRLYVRIGGKTVMLTATFPMMSVVKCRLLPGYGKYLAEVRKDEPVFAYREGAEKESDAAVIKQSGSASELSMLCGKAVTSDNVKEYLKLMGPDYEEAAYESSKVFYYSWKKKGISISFSTETAPATVKAIFIYNEGADKFSIYPQEWPEKILPSDTRKDVEEKIGPPQQSGGSGSIPFWAAYPRFGLYITYTGLSTTDMGNGIHHIAITAPQ